MNAMAAEDSRLGRQSAIAEAHALYRMIGEENTVEDLRELIVVSAWTKRVAIWPVLVNEDGNPIFLARGPWPQYASVTLQGGTLAKKKTGSPAKLRTPQPFKP
jgi:hypothetical protein